MDYRVMVSVMITPKDEGIYSNLSFSKSYELHGERFSDIASQIDFIYDMIDGNKK